MLRRSLLPILLAAATAPGAGAQPAALPSLSACALPPDLIDPARLPRTRAALERGRLRILVGGSAEPTGTATALYHARLREALNALLPQVEVTVEARGRRGATAGEVWTLLEAGLASFRPHLVIWQTGTVEAARSLELGEFVDKLSEGITRCRIAGADIMLLEPQFSRFLRANADIERYRDAMRLVAAAEGIPLLRRFEWMRGWAEQGLDLERVGQADRPAALARLHECVAQAIAAQIHASTRP
ncbi:MAG: SGNH/GDSL hydrolase family protein [Rhodovarius sp.]|nr:SGNH/GDSL hydrolase family protein [Rhodovarius sp.]MDW8315126.1 SGNH/GDSL hydrolase family protein [Rhodovarius sp.]